MIVETDVLQMLWLGFYTSSDTQQWRTCDAGLQDSDPPTSLAYLRQWRKL